MQLDVSVIIPSFNRPRETVRAVRSVLEQTGVAVEVIVVDDASPIPLHLPHELLRTDRVRLLRLETNSGAAVARNTGVAVSRADIIAFLDSDDFFLPHSLAPRVIWFRDQERLRPILASAGVWRWNPGRSARMSFPLPASMIGELASGCWYFPGSTTLMSRQTWEAIGPFDPQLRRLEDLDWGIRLSMAGGELRVSKEVAAVISRSPPARSQAIDAAAACLLNRYGPSGEAALPRKAFQALRAYLALEQANAAYGEGRYYAMTAALLWSFISKPRLSLHQGRRWLEKAAGAEEFAQIEELSAL